MLQHSDWFTTSVCSSGYLFTFEKKITLECLSNMAVDLSQYFHMLPNATNTK